MIHHISKLIEEGEHLRLDFKFEVTDAHKIARTLVAFANSEGGRLLIGVKDDGSIVGIRSDEESFMVESAAKKFCRPPVSFSFREWNLRKKIVLEVMVPKSLNRPHYAQHEDGKWTPYLRVRDQNFVASRIQLNVWKKENKPKGVFLKFTDAEKFLMAHLETQPSITVSEFAGMAGISSNKAEQILVRFLLLKIIQMHFTENQQFFTLHPASATHQEV
ncbi:MAG: ATP-binding protein [Bacteroidota bacterium]